MTNWKLPAQLPQALNKGSNAIIAVAVIYGLYVLQKAYSAGDRLANQATKPIGQAWSDVSAWAGGWRAVELTPLVIQPWYLDNDYRITGQAWDVLTKDQGYRELMLTLFEGKTLKQQYRHLIGQPITQGDL